ncbi:MAG TPA: ribonuclease III [Leptospiraceae bacterium]|nr:ribonuclease III [Leptospiraceae bacterium]HMW07864.1 ribonuclease III [Leptospiraceae bacterium]HMX32350.1 ribonuclease III [Leptospiraceae bacterium]HMY32669.1 ribonuclease III [Leptospiraceae bacterium]HMZ66043.1 ribonuclease III [Leptospiraceae bacterium]
MSRPTLKTSPNKQLPPERVKELKDLIKHIKIPFQDLVLLNSAFTHKSFLNETHMEYEDNERLEFLGDSALSLVVSSYLYQRFPKDREGKLSKVKSRIVSGAVLSKIAIQLGLNRYLLLGKGEKANGGDTNRSNLENVLEALLGAIYLEHGIQAVADFILPHVGNIVDNELHSYKDHQTALQEFCQKKFKFIPDYELIAEEGPDHNKVFKVKVSIKNVGEKIGMGNSKQKARQDAASKMLKYMKIKNA